jgi:hypothetical protein
MVGYNNLLSFIVGNEVANSVNIDGYPDLPPLRGYLAIPCVKALTRDARKFMNSCASMRSVPLMYTATDFGERDRRLVAEYLACDQNLGGGAIDIYGINVYTWCSELATINTRSTYGILAEGLKDYNLPVVFSEYGCNQQDFLSTYNDLYATKQRTWKQAGPEGIYGVTLSDVFSGGFAYQYSMTYNDFGIAILQGFSKEYLNTPVTTLASYDNLKMELGLAKSTIEQRNERGEWTDSNFCDWAKQPAGTEPMCPDATEVQQMFTEAGFPAELPQNWCSALLHFSLLR